MYAAESLLWSNLQQLNGAEEGGYAAAAVRQALGLYNRALVGAWLAGAWSRLSGRSGQLRDLAADEHGRAAGDRHYAGLQAVAITQIRGSEGRGRDFDRWFHPLQEHSRARWLRVASARLRGMALPPVELVRVGDVFYVRDGHHRISVARAMGEQVIDAEVTVWQNRG